jgi:hypothetical protein
MASGALDHMVSLIIFMAAITIFIGLFSQNMQAGIAYERHSSLSTKTCDLLDNILLNPGIPSNWGQSDGAIVGFGLQDPAYTEYRLSSFSCMRLTSTQPTVYYSRTSTYYKNMSVGFGGYLLAPTTKCVNYSTVSKILGVNGTYGFQLSLKPTITVSIQEVSIAPLQFSVSVDGTGYPFADAPLSYTLLLVNQNTNNYPSYTIVNGVSSTDMAGLAHLSFPQVTSEIQSYALIVYSYLDGFKGVGYYIHDSPNFTKTVVPIVDSFQGHSIMLVHGDTIGQQIPGYSQLNYNSSFFILAEDYTLRQVVLDSQNASGQLISGGGNGQDYVLLTVPSNDGILVVTYKDVSGQYGVVLMPWGLGALAFPLTFGGNPVGQEWVTTDIRQVTINGFAYQAQLSLWNLQGYSETG